MIFRDKQVRDFLDSSRNSWRDLNVPEPDGQLLYDIILKNNYKNAVEIGKDMDPKLTVGGCFVTHNVSPNNNYSFYEYVSKLPNYKTTLDNRGAGVAVSYKKAK